MGKAYVLNEDYPIVCIGAANVDRKFYVHKDLVAETSNPVTSTRSIGGVARNIAETRAGLAKRSLFYLLVDKIVNGKLLNDCPHHL